MTYAYGTHGAPAVGGGLPGLPQRQSSAGKIERSSYTRIVTPGSGVITPPDGAKYMRVAIGGCGGNGGSGAAVASGGTVYGSAGGGCAATIILPASPIAYSLPNLSTSVTPASVAHFLGRTIEATAGQHASTALSQGSFARGGIGIGGDYNHKGGDGYVGSSTAVPGAGAAGPMGDGADGHSSDLPAPSDGWGVPGGMSGNSWSDKATGGGGMGAIGGSVINDSTTTLTIRQNAYTPSVWGEQSMNAPNNGLVSGRFTAGGVLGGGGAVRATAGAGTPSGGVGGIVVEWFY